MAFFDDLVDFLKVAKDYTIGDPLNNPLDAALLAASFIPGAGIGIRGGFSVGRGILPKLLKQGAKDVSDSSPNFGMAGMYAPERGMRGGSYLGGQPIRNYEMGPTDEQLGFIRGFDDPNSPFADLELGSPLAENWMGRLPGQMIPGGDSPGIAPKGIMDTNRADDFFGRRFPAGPGGRPVAGDMGTGIPFTREHVPGYAERYQMGFADMPSALGNAINSQGGSSPGRFWFNPLERGRFYKRPKPDYQEPNIPRPAYEGFDPAEGSRSFNETWNKVVNQTQFEESLGLRQEYDFGEFYVQPGSKFDQALGHRGMRALPPGEGQPLEELTQDYFYRGQLGGTDKGMDMALDLFGKYPGDNPVFRKWEIKNAKDVRQQLVDMILGLENYGTLF